MNRGYCAPGSLPCGKQPNARRRRGIPPSCLSTVCFWPVTPSYMRVSLPESIAEELIDDRLAVRPIATRGGPLTETVAVAIGSLNAVSAMVTIVLGAPAIKKIL